MFIINENEREYRFGESGPKYLMKGPRMNFALVRFLPGEDFQAHYHNVMEEDFFILEGKVDIIVDGKKNVLSAGDLIHIEPGEVHYVKNAYDVPVKMVSTLAPFQEVDKVTVDNPEYWYIQPKTAAAVSRRDCHLVKRRSLTGLRCFAVLRFWYRDFAHQAINHFDKILGFVAFLAFV